MRISLILIIKKALKNAFLNYELTEKDRIKTFEIRYIEDS